MELTIKYFGMLAEITACQEERMPIAANTVSALLNSLYNKYPGLRTKDFRVALNQSLVTDDTPLSHGEIALLPPFAGG